MTNSQQELEFKPIRCPMWEPAAGLGETAETTKRREDV